MKDEPPIDLGLGLLSAQAVHLRGEAKDFLTDVIGQVFLGEDRRRRVGDGEYRDDIEVAFSWMKLSPAPTAGGLSRVGVICAGGVG